MDISLLTEKITFQKNTVNTDEIGNHRNVWTDYYTCHATVSGESGRETQTAGTTVEESDIAFTVRWCKKVSDIDSTGYRIVFNGELYNITFVNHMNYKKVCIKFLCRKVRR
jgi:SPP1 family predicted phage head-tail adaptor